MQKFYNLLKVMALAICLLPAMGFSDKRVDTRNQASLEQSLDAIMAELSLKEQIEFLEAFFRIAYASDPARTPYARAQQMLLLSRGERSTYPTLSAMAYVSDKRMDEMTPSHAYQVWKTSGYSKNESYIQFILIFGDAVDGMSGHEIMGTARRVRGAQDRDAQNDEIKKLEGYRDRYIKQLREAEARWGSCQNYQQTTLRKNIEITEANIASVRAGGEATLRVSPNTGISVPTCRGKPAAAPMRNMPTIKSGSQPLQQQAAPASNAGHDAYLDAVGHMRVLKVDSLKFASRSDTQGQLELVADISPPRVAGKTVQRVNFYVMAFPKRGGEPIYFRGYLSAMGADGITGEDVQMFATVRQPAGISDKKGDYQVGVVVDSFRYADGTEDTLVTNMDDFKRWVASQPLQN